MRDARHIAMSLPYYGHETTLVDDQDSGDIILWLKKNHKQNQAQYDSIAMQFWQGNTQDTARYLFDFCKKNIRYSIEPKSRQTVKTPGAIMHEGVGDCKHYSSFINGIADALNRKGYPISCMYRFVSDDPAIDVHHVFAVVKNGSSEYWVDPVINTFNKRPVFYNTKNVPMPLKQISGTGAIGSCMIGRDGYVYVTVPRHTMGAINDARNYKAKYMAQDGNRATWTADQYNKRIAEMVAIRQKENKGVSHDEAWGAQMYMDDNLSKELAAVSKKTGGLESYPGMVQVDVGPGGNLYSHPVASATPNVPMPNIANTTVQWTKIMQLPPIGKWYAWANKYPPKQGVAKEVDKAVEAARDVVLKVTMAPARNAFLALVALNVASLATRLYDGWGANRDNVMRIWQNNFGGAGSALIDAINNGLKKSSAPTHRVSGSSIGEPISISAMMALAAAIIAALAKFMSKDPGSNANIANQVKSGIQNISSLQGLNATTSTNADGSLGLSVTNFTPPANLTTYDGQGAITTNANADTDTSLPTQVADDVAKGATDTTNNIFDHIEAQAKQLWADHKTQITYVLIGIAALKFGPALLGKRTKKRR